MEFRKEYVKVLASHDVDGTTRPVAIRYQGRRFEVQAVTEIVPRAALKTGGAGMRYRVRIDGKETYLFDEAGRWFVEARV